MDFGIESESLSSNFFHMRIRESGLSQDAQNRPRKSPHKRLKVVRTSASLVIDQLKSIFWCPGDFMSHVRTRRNWRPEFLIKYLRDNRRGCNEGCNTVLRHGKRNFAPEAPKIYSIGLHSGARDLSDSDDLSSSCGAIRSLKKRFSIVRRPMIMCKYWIAQSTPTLNSSPDVSLKAHIDRQTMVIDCTESTEIIPKYNRAEKNNHNSHHSQLHEHIEEKESVTLNTLRNDRAAGDHSFISDNFTEPSVKKDHKCGSFRTTRDAESQTLNRKRRRRTKKRSKPATEKISRRKHCNNEPRIVADFRPGSIDSLSRRSYHDEPWLCVRVLESKRAEYINKFTTVNRHIEEITATLRETCCSDENSRNNLENCDKYFSSISDDAKINTSEEKDDLVNVKRIIGESESDLCKNMQEIFHIDNLNNETVSSPKDTIVSSRNPEISNYAFGRDSVRAFTIKEAVYSSNRISSNKAKAKYRFVKQMSFDLDLTKNGHDELQGFSIENELFGEDCLKNNFASNNEHARDLAENLTDLEESRYCKKIDEEKLGEAAILEDIKKRIDRDFDDPLAERSENDTEDFFTVSQKSSNLDRHDIINVTSVTTIGKSKSTPLIVSTNLKPAEIQIHKSMSIGAMSEYSNKNSTLSKYFSCTQIPSLISLTENENENELAVEAIDRNIIAHDSYSNPHSNSHCYDYSRSNLSLNNCSLSNLDTSFDRSRSSLEYIARYNPSTQYTSPNKFLIETVNEPDDTFEIFEDREGFAENKIYEWERPPLGESKREGKKSRVEPEKRCTIDSTFETSKSSRYVGSIDSGVFSSSLIDLYPAESSFDAGRSEFKKKRRAGKLDGSSAAIDSDSSCTDDTLDRKVNDVIRDLTENLILCERRARMKLKAREARYPRDIMSRACKFSRNLYDTCCEFFSSPRQSSEDERIVSISTPSLLSLSDSEIEGSRIETST